MSGRDVATQTSDRPHEHEEGGDHGLEWSDLARIALVALAAGAVWFRLWEPFPRVSIVGLVATVVGGYPIFKEALQNRGDEPNEDRKSTRLNSSHQIISYAVFCLKKKTIQ